MAGGMGRLRGARGGDELGEPVGDAAGEHVDVGRAVVVAGDAERDPVEVGEDRDSDPQRRGDRHLRDDLHERPAERV
jgi:hypothetical protein